MLSQKKVRQIAGVISRFFPDSVLGTIVDPRSPQGKRWKDHIAMLRVAMVGIAAGCQGVGEVEEMTANMPNWVKKLLGIERRLPDTTLREFLCELNPKDICKLLAIVGYDAWRRKALQEVTDIPFGVLSLDGKYPTVRDIGAGKKGTYEYLQVHHEATGEPSYGVIRTITATFITAQGRPILGAEPVPGNTNEVGYFGKAFEEMVRYFGKLFQVVMYDAGGASQSNAQIVLKNGKDFIFQIADPRWVMYETMELLMRDKKPDETQEEMITTRKRIVRKVNILKNHHTQKNLTIWQEVNTMIRVVSETYEDDVLTGSKTRYFVSSLKPSALTASQWLRVIILRWGVESCHQILDTAFVEDKKLWITSNAQGALVVMLLRRVVYTILTLFKWVTMRSDENRMMPWRKLLEWFSDALKWPNSIKIDDLRPRSFALPPALA